jgi:nitrite reductase/ring-hydroxylating ferredoxin subunit
MKTAYRYPFSPFPSGWFAIGQAADIQADVIKTLHYFGRELIAFRDPDNKIHVLDAHCPHLGAHLGVGGKLENGCITCPFHSWQFNSHGECIHIPYSGHIPERGKLHAYPVMEWAGLLIVYFSLDKCAPDWTPDLPVFDPQHWSIFGHRAWRVRVHIQEIGENGLDMPHFKSVHSAEIPQLVRAEGMAHKFYISVKPWPDSPQAKFLDGIDRTLWGLGISVNSFEGKVPSRVVITRTPIDEQYSDITLVFIPKNQGNPETTALFGKALMDHISKEVEQDVPIWENKIYAEHPALTKGDGPIAAWRKWCQQFYEEKL